MAGKICIVISLLTCHQGWILKVKLLYLVFLKPYITADLFKSVNVMVVKYYNYFNF